MFKSIQPKLKRIIDLAKYNIYYTISLLVHVLVLFGFSLGGADGTDGTNGNRSKFKGISDPSKDILIKEKQNKVEVEVIDNKDEEIKLPKKKKVINAEKECPNDWYGGIGIQTMNLTGEEQIFKVFPGYFADNAGVQIGDVLLEVKSDDGNIYGPPGTEVCLLLQRDSNKFKVCIIRGKVCYSAKRK